MLKNNKKIVIIITVILLVLLIAAGTIFILSKNEQKSKQTTTTQQTADSLKDKAIKALQSNDKTNAKILFEKAQKQYKELNTSDVKTSDQIDVEAQLWLIDHPTKQSSTIDTDIPTTN